MYILKFFGGGNKIYMWVTILEFLEIEVDNRGTKSTFLEVVKAQRINGDRHINMSKIYSTVGLPLGKVKPLSRPFLSNIKLIAMVRSKSSLSNAKREELVKESPN